MNAPNTPAPLVPVSLSKNPSITEWNHILALAEEPGPCGQFLRQVEPWILREPARREDTWNFMLGVKDLPKQVRQFIYAAKSTDYATERLARIALGTASTITDWNEELKDAVRSNDKTKIKKLSGKIFSQWEMFEPGHLETIVPAYYKNFIRAKKEEMDAKLNRRLGSRKAKELRLERQGTAKVVENLWIDHPVRLC